MAKRSNLKPNLMRASTRLRLTEVPIAMVEDYTLPAGSIDLFTALRCLPDDYVVTVKGLVARFGKKYSEASLRRVIAALEARGWLIRGRLRVEGGRLGTDTIYFVNDERALYDAYCEILKGYGYHIISKRPEFLDSLKNKRTLDIHIEGLERDVFTVDAKGKIVSEPKRETAGQSQRGEIATLGATCGNAEIDANTVENDVENPEISVENLGNQNSPQNAENCGVNPSLPSSQPTSRFSNVGQTGRYKPIGNNLTTIETNFLTIRPSDELTSLSDRAPEAGTPDGGGRPAAPPRPDQHGLSGWTDGGIGEGRTAPLAGPAPLPSPGTPETAAGATEGHGDAPDAAGRPSAPENAASALSAMCSAAINRNRLTSAADRAEMARLVEDLADAGFAPSEVVRAWSAKQQACVSEGRTPQYFPQLLRWLSEEAPAQLERERQRAQERRSASPVADDAARERAIRFAALKDADPAFARLVEELREREQDLKFGLCSAEDAQAAREAMQGYFRKHADAAAEARPATREEMI